MVLEIQDELIFGYETFREEQVQKEYAARYKLMVTTTLQRNIIYFYIKKDGTVAYRCWLGEHKEVQVTPTFISEIPDLANVEKYPVDFCIELTMFCGSRYERKKHGNKNPKGTP